MRFGTSDFTAVINRIKVAAPEVIFPFEAGQDGLTFLRQLSDFGVHDTVRVCADSIEEPIVPSMLSAQACLERSRGGCWVARKGVYASTRVERRSASFVG